jgi:4-hydroxy-tetrahydrodipicolinate reductase
VRVAIAGSGGRMGRTLIEAVLADGALSLSGALEVEGNPVIGKDSGELAGAARTGVMVSADYAATIAQADCLIDFTRPEGTLAHLAACVNSGARMVIGTTGLSEDDKQVIREASQSIAIVFSPNMAVGVNVVFKLAEVAAKALGEGYDVEIIEAHHRHKVDAPSGTALHLGKIVAEALQRDLSRSAQHGREGVTGERDRTAIGFHAIRGGDIVGEHTVMFAGPGERVEVVVRSGNRLTYALGALRAARFLENKRTGLFDMQDVLGLR